MSVLPNAHHLEDKDMALTQTSEEKTLVSSSVRYRSTWCGGKVMRLATLLPPPSHGS